MKQLLKRISNIGIVPVVKINSAEDILPLAHSLYKGGIDCAEITFRSEHALLAIQTITKELPDMLIGAGTVRSAQQAQQAIEAGASFIVTPGFNPEVTQWCLDNKVLILPGVSSASEIEMANVYGLKHLKFFPAESSGGAKKLKDLSAPYNDIMFMPTGGVNAVNMHDYLSLPNVFAAGGSFMLPQDRIDNGDWDTIESLSKDAIRSLLKYRLIHIGINNGSSDDAMKTANLLCSLFNFTYHKKPRSHFAGEGFELLNEKGRGEHGHIGIYTPYPERALYQLSKLEVHAIEETITRNKKTDLINFVYLDLELSGFAIHLINPDIKM